MISIVIPSLNAETVLAPTLNALIPAALDGLVKEAILADGGSTDGSLQIAEAAGMEVVKSERGRGAQLRAGAEAAKGDWLLFLDPGTVLDLNWIDEAAVFIEQIERGERPEAAAAFRFALDQRGLVPWLLETLVALRVALFNLPSGEQGLLISRRLYDELGGFQPVPRMEDVELVRKLRRGQLVTLDARAVTSAIRYRRDGYLLRGLRNLSYGLLNTVRVPPRLLSRLYG